MDVALRRRALYKGTAPPWKETYRQRCVERLKNNRSRLLDRYRQVGENGHCTMRGSFLVQEVMEQELRALHFRSTDLPSRWQKDSRVLDMLEDFDELTVLEEIKQELMLEEQSMIEEIDKVLAFEEACFHSAIGLNAENQIACPVCKRNNLHVLGHVIECPCGVHINTQLRVMTVQQLQLLLEEALTEHRSQCLHQPVFSVTTAMEGKSNLFMSCQVCDSMMLIL
ncbi:RPA-interacting protein [Rhinatrema bivittatum]|uniref:RPA-interacting protein n=1 Tax=Rhinatrema bivittatum TaxID=194408 RepID=UPI00112CC73A|nr:RPA-interacting protein [Rhinatrema bivittatum]